MQLGRRGILNQHEAEVRSFSTGIEDDTVGVVDELGFVAELDGLAQASFAVRAGVDIMEADSRCADSGITPARRLRVWATTRSVCPTKVLEVVDRPVLPASALPSRSAQRASGVAQHRGRLPHGLFGDPGQFTDDPAHRGLGLIALLLTTQPHFAAIERARRRRHRSAQRGSGLIESSPSRWT